MSTNVEESCDQVSNLCSKVNDILQKNKDSTCEKSENSVDASENCSKENQTVPENSGVEEIKTEMEKGTNEQGNVQEKLKETEKKLTVQQSPTNATSAKDDPVQLQRLVDELKKSLKQTQLKLTERDRLVVNQEKQIGAFTNQVSSLKEVIALTKNMLEIRNMEVKHLQDDINSMETKISAERSRHDAMLNKMDAAVRLNSTLKTEYETQLHLFQDLRGKYEEKIALLMAEKNNSSHAL